MDPNTQQELAYILLIELMSYQFCSPVRWIETQDVILDDLNAERVIEIGPSNTLTAMSKRTVDSKYAFRDSARGIRRQLLCSKSNSNEIYYIRDPIEAEISKEPTKNVEPTPTHTIPLGMSTPPLSQPQQILPIQQRPPQLEDTSITATEIVRSIIAIALKKPAAEISFSSSIKVLTSGRSALQNEIIGDLMKEFTTIPAGAEDLTLDALSSEIQATFDGNLGKHSQTMVARMVSAKMFGGSSTSAVRSYMENQWGLQSGRQDSVLVLALSLQPTARFPSKLEMETFLDDTVKVYFQSSGLVIPTASSTANQNSNGASAMDPAAYKELTKTHSHFVEKIHKASYQSQEGSRTNQKLLDDSIAKVSELREELDIWNDEHGETYGQGIRPIFKPIKMRMYDSSWNWGMQEALSIFYDLKRNRIRDSDHVLIRRKLQVTNRATKVLIDALRYLLFGLRTENSDCRFARATLELLIKECQSALNQPPVAKNLLPPTAPRTKVDENGQISSFEIPRIEGGWYLSKSSSYPSLEQFPPSNDDIQLEFKSGVGGYPDQSISFPKTPKKINISDDGTDHKILPGMLVGESYIISGSTKVANSDTSGSSNGSTTGDSSHTSVSWKSEGTPVVFLRRKERNGWQYADDWSSLYLETLESASLQGLSFANKNVLVTGAGEGSIGAKVLEGLLAGGARVVVTTSSYSSEVLKGYQSIYSEHGARGSQLVVVPFNQASQRDIVNLIAYIYDSKSGLGWDLDHIIPFAAISENGREVDNLDSKSELAHRLMLTNTLRLLGAVKKEKAALGITCRPAQAILPLSANHGTFGNDGLYAESKLALEALFSKWHSENWSDYLSICGAAIGWTRGTNLMSSNDIVSEGIERLGVRTFSRDEMSFNILSLMSPKITLICQTEPILADLNGGMETLPDIKSSIIQIREDIMETSEINRAIAQDLIADKKAFFTREAAPVKINQRANIHLEFPRLPDFKTEIEPLSNDLKGMVDLEKVVVIAGFAEVGPWGNSRTRWQMEAYGTFTLEGWVEIAWIMGLIKHHDGVINGQEYSGWVERETSKPIADVDVEQKFKSKILKHAGIRITDPLHPDEAGNPSKQRLHEIIVQDDLEPFEASEETANDFKREHKDKVEILQVSDSEYSIRLKKGATLMISKAVQASPTVVGKVPNGWSPEIYGIDETIINQVDPVTLFSLVCTVEALLSAGITDAYELYQYIHVSELGNCLGSGVGGGTSFKKIFKSRFLDKTVQNDILQESFINTTAAWVNMLLLSSSGPIKTPVGACATGLESLDNGYDLIVRGKAKVCLVGGFDNTIEDISDEFGNMKATINVKNDLARGRVPGEMSRPMASSRDGFVESQGCGIQILTSAKVALDMGLPIHGIVALTTTASDTIGRSIPAAGKGLLTTARETTSLYQSPMMKPKYRRMRLERRRIEIEEMRQLEVDYLKEEIDSLSKTNPSPDLSQYIRERNHNIELERSVQEREALNCFGNNFWANDARISPLRGALAVWGLGIDDLDFASFHGTSTVQGDKNELDVIQSQLSHLGRRDGNTLLGIFQKHLTGHPKGAAGAWMVNGCLQTLATGLVPGNRNADNIDKAMEKYHHITIPSRSIQTDGMKAFSVTSFGFGQKGAQMIGVHPRYLYATISEEEFARYQVKLEKRQRTADRRLLEAITKNTMVREKTAAPYSTEHQKAYLLAPESRLERVV